MTSKISIFVKKYIIMDILLEKSVFLKRFEQINDIELIKTLNTLLDYTIPRQKKSIELSEIEDLPESYELSVEHKKILDERLLSFKNNPENLISWEVVKKRIRTK